MERAMDKPASLGLKVLAPLTAARERDGFTSPPFWWAGSGGLTAPTGTARGLCLAAGRAGLQRRLNLAREGVEEPLLVGTDLVKAEMIEASLGVLADSSQVSGGIRSADDFLRHCLLSHECRVLGCNEMKSASKYALSQRGGCERATARLAFPY